MPALSVYLINLDRSTDRLAAMVEQFERLDLPWKRVTAVDGRAFGPLPWEGYDHRAYSRNWGKVHRGAEFGCYLSHLTALRMFLADGADVAMIVEDDAVFSETLPEALDDALASRADWDVLKLAGIHFGMPATVRTLGGGRRLVAFLQAHTGSAAYLVNRRAAERYVARLLPMRVPYDHEFDKAWRYGIRLRGLLPLPIGMRRAKSTIDQAPRRSIKRPWYRRGGVFLYRTAIEIRRAAHYLFSDTAWMAPGIRRLAGARERRT